MDDDLEPFGESNGLPMRDGRQGGEEPLEALSLVVAHLAAQLTMTQIRLRALATALEVNGVVDPAVVQGYVAQVADREAGFYLRENLGDVLAGMIEVDQLAREIVEFMGQAD